MMDLQAHINSMYPPTHTFEVGPPLKATGVLEKRMQIVHEHFEEFLSGVRLLDIGCSKGFMSLSLLSSFKQVVGIDNNTEAIETCNKLRRVHEVGSAIMFEAVSFRNFISVKRFDRIFIGNGPHHMYKEIGGHEWIGKLAALSSDLILTEGPFDISCVDLKAEPENYSSTYDSFQSEMEKYFTLVKRVASVSYSPDRFVALWKRLPFEPITEKYFVKQYRKDEYVDNNIVDIFVASTSPVSNGLLDIDVCNWAERYCDERPYKYFENELNAFAVHCANQVYLAKLGYVDIDPATINIFSESNLCFDKSGVMPIVNLTEKHIVVYVKLLKQSYKDKAIIARAESLYNVLVTKCAIEIEKAFQCLR